MNDRQHRPQWRKSSFSGSSGSCVELAEWRKSTYSGQAGSCVEFATDADIVLMRDSKLGDNSPILVFDRPAMADFLDRAKAGAFDDLC
jgi:Domain of unknown function (DUF397)